MNIYQQLADAGFEEKAKEHGTGESGKCIECAFLDKGCELIFPAIEEYGHSSLVWRGGCNQWRVHPNLRRELPC